MRTVLKDHISHYRAALLKRTVFVLFFLFFLVLFSFPEGGDGKTTGREGTSNIAKEKNFSTAVTLYYQGDFQGSLEKFRRLAATYPSCEKTRFNLDLLLREKGEFTEALEHFAALVKEYPTQVDYRLAFTVTAYLDGESRQALEYSQLLPETAETLFWRGLILKDLHREKAAVEVLEKSLALESYHPLAHYFLGQLHFTLADYEKARVSYQRALTQESNMTSAFYPLAASYLQLEKFNTAYNLLQRAEASLPWNQTIKEERKFLETNHPHLVQERRQEERIRREAMIPPKVEPTAEREGISAIRIGLAEAIREVQVKTGGYFRLIQENGRSVDGPPHTVLHFRQVTGGVEVLNDEDGSLFLKAAGPLVLSYENPAATSAVFNLEFGRGYFWAGQEDRMYRGQLEFLPRSSGLTVVNRLNVEEYLYSVVPAEMPASWPAAALEAQAVAARTYTFANMGRYGARGFDLLSTVLSAAYPGIRSETPSTRAAVDATRGQILTCNSRPITAVYSANSAGFTESSREVWNFDHSYLQAVPDKNLPPEIAGGLMTPEELATWLTSRPLTHSSHPSYSSRAAYRWRLWMPREELEARIGQGEKLGRIVSITTAGRGPSGRVKKVQIKGTAGEYTVSGDRIRSQLGGLRSNLFIVEPKIGPDGLPEFFIFTGGGWGHGVGMCQSGAAGMAAAGYSSREILNHYYPGAVLTTRY